MLAIEIYFCALFLTPVIASNAPNSYWIHTPNIKPGIRIQTRLPSFALIVRMTKKWNNKDVYTTELFLKRKFNTASQNDHCNYIGHVHRHRNSTIAALTGCVGKQDVYTTITNIIVSEDGTSWSEGSEETYLWKLNGDVEEINNNQGEIMDIVKNDELKNTTQLFDMDVLKFLNVSKLHSNILIALCK